MKKIKTAIILLLAALLLAGSAFAETSETVSREEFKTPFPVTGTLSEDEKKLDAVLTRMKQEADKLYPSTVPYALIDWDESLVHEGLRRFCRELPKGADLHTHDDKVIPMDRYIRILKEYGKACIVLEDGPDYGNLYVKDPPENAVSLNEAFSEGKLSEEKFREIFSIPDADVPNGRWERFNRLFTMVRGQEKDPELLQMLYEEAFRSCCENKVFLLETRVILTGDEEAVAERLRLIRDAYYHVKDEYPDFVVRVIGNSRKKESVTKETAVGILRIVMHLSGEIRDEYDPAHPKDFIIGLDLVNEEDKSKPLREYADFFISDEVKESGLKLFLHAGESLRYDNEEVIDAYLYGASRIGHGFNLFRFPKVMEKCREEGIAIEIAPISNYRLGYVSDFRLHPGQIYLRYGIPIVICSDDGLFLEREPLTDDFYAVILSWNLGVAEIKELCRNAIVYAGLSQEETDVLLAKWEKDWNEFVMNFRE